MNHYCQPRVDVENFPRSISFEIVEEDNCWSVFHAKWNNYQLDNDHRARNSRVNQDRLYLVDDKKFLKAFGRSNL